MKCFSNTKFHLYIIFLLANGLKRAHNDSCNICKTTRNNKYQSLLQQHRSDDHSLSTKKNLLQLTVEKIK